MIGRLSDWFNALTQRERLLVGVLGVIIAALVLVYGIILPVGAAHDAAHERHRAVTEQAGRVQAGLAMLKNAPERSASAPSQSLNITIAASAEAQGFTLQSNQPRGNDATAIIIPAALPGPALVWLNELENQGIQLETLTMTPSPDGKLSLNASLRRNAP